MSSSLVTLTAADGFSSSAYVSQPSDTPKGALVVLQEIFGVNSHIRGVANGYAAAGYLAIAPATFDRIERNIQLGYTPDEITRGSGLKAAVEVLPAPGVLQDIPGCGRLRRQGRQGRHRRLLLGRPAGLALGRESARPVRGGGLLRRRHDSRQRALAQARGTDDGALR